MRYNSCIKTNGRCHLERERPSKGIDGQKGSLMRERERETTQQGEKIARKAERENITLDPDRGGGCLENQFDSEREKIVRAERRREK